MTTADTTPATNLRGVAARFAVLGLILILLTACATPQRTLDPPSAGPAATPVSPRPSATSTIGSGVPDPTLDPNDPFARAPAVVRDRLPLASCGSESVVPGAGINVAGRRCFGAAVLAMQGAEFISALVTIEGDPIVFIYRNLSDAGGAEALIDSTQDTYSSRKWLHLRCSGFVIEESAPGQPEIGLGDDCMEEELE
jgi:hypothetical protein